METSSKRGTVRSLSLATLLASLGASAATAGLPALGEALGASFAQARWVVLAYLVAATALLVVAGRLGDLLGGRRLLLAGVALFAAASLLCGLAPGLELLLAGRAAQGLGAAVLLTLPLALAGQGVPGPELGRALGRLGASSALGTALGPSLGGLLVAALGWRAPYLALVPLGLLTLLVARRHLPPDGPAPDRRGLDLAGMLRVAVALRGPLTASALVSAVMMATLVVGPFHLSQGLGLAPVAAGLVLSAGPAVAALAGGPAGRLVDRLGARRAVVAALLVMGSGALGLALLAPGVAAYLAPLAALSAGYALFQAANAAAALTGLEPTRRGVGAGLLALSRSVGLVTGASVLGAVFAWTSGTGSPEAVALGTRTTFGAAALLLLAAQAVAGPLRQAVMGPLPTFIKIGIRQS